MRLLRTCVAVTLWLLVSSVAQASAPPKDHIPPSKPTVDVASAAGLVRPTFQFGARDNRTSSLKIRFRCALDGIALHPCARTYKSTDTLPFGKHSIRVVALDATGNVSRPTIAPFNVIGTWDAASDFAAASSPQNPSPDGYGNTVWSYLDSPSLTHDPTQYLPLPHFRVFNSSAWSGMPESGRTGRSSRRWWACRAVRCRSIPTGMALPSSAGAAPSPERSTLESAFASPIPLSKR